MGRCGDGGFFSQPTAEELQRNAAASRKKAQRQGTVLEPVVVQGRAIARSWWGRAWCENLERYADFESRLDRGKRYVRTGAVLDLKIREGKVLARVQGSRKTPYRVEVLIDPLPEERCQRIIQGCSRKFQNLEELTSGSFPEDMKGLFLERDGLFPSPKEIRFSCSCPDWAHMCKHVAATLYGVGTRLDEDPTLFFTLRGIDLGQFIDATVSNRVEIMLQNAQRPSGRILEGEDLSALFGVG